MKIILHWIVASLAVFITAYLLPGVEVSGFMAALLAALIIGILNAFIRPALLILTLPINILSLGLFTLFINAFLIMLASKIVPGFSVDGLFWALAFSLVLSLVNFFLHRFKNDN
ncbi:MAG: hypothetical protein ACD_11C00076G0011 [uncultured bacterium]|nr:MAG: hypothetical protein ACD_11C00076G0011 [uncultured bacterium]